MFNCYKFRTQLQYFDGFFSRRHCVTKHICPSVYLSVVECLSFCPYIVKRQSVRPSVRCLSVLRQHTFVRNVTTVRQSVRSSVVHDANALNLPRVTALVAQPYWGNIEPILNQSGTLPICRPRCNGCILTSCQYPKIVYSRYLGDVLM